MVAASRSASSRKRREGDRAKRRSLSFSSRCNAGAAGLVLAAKATARGRRGLFNLGLIGLFSYFKGLCGVFVENPSKLIPAAPLDASTPLAGKPL